jgi:acyl transferase domain-containing protein/thioesterase domain-containing protein
MSAADRSRGGSSGAPLAPGSVAVVGMAGRFPAAASVAELWQLLDQEREAARWLTDEELLAANVSPSAIRDPNYVRASLILPDMEMFDAEFFGFSPRDAAILDPQHRHFLECAWEALEDAGHMPDRFPGSIGVFAGCGMQAYLAYNLLSNPELLEQVGLFLLRHTGNDKDFLPTRLSYLLNLQGPSVAVQTACSTSLVAIHMACQSLLTGSCDMALAGGVSIELPHRRGYRFTEGEILSPTGHCRAFDDDAKGTLFGSGAGVVVLRRLEDALESGDNIHLVIRGSAVNNDGSQKAGYLAPSVDGQARAAAEALAVADVDASSVAYIEAHGTGTAVGDPIELAALAQVYGDRDRGGPCGIGSIKTNIGHLDTAAGVASLIKVALAMRHEKIPASLNYRRPNSRFDFAKSRFYVVDHGRPWPRDDSPRRAAVNSLGVGGTNAHTIVEEPPVRVATAAEQDWQILTLSARSEPALARLRDKWRQFLADPPLDFTVANAAFTSQVGRRAFDHRCAVIARDNDGLRSALEGRDTRRVVTDIRAPERRIVFMFPGGGAQYPGAARELYERVSAFRDAVEECFLVMPTAVPADLRRLMFECDGDDAEAARTLEQPVRSLASLFVLGYAFAALWRHWGVVPNTVIGHSAGEYLAAVIAGVMTLKDALSIVVLRGQIFERMEPGGMLAVQMPESKLRFLLGEELDLAAVNGADLCVASGAVPALEALETRLRTEDVESRRVRINVAAHSRLLDPHLDTFRACVRKLRLSSPRIAFVSTLTGEPVAGDQLTAPEYWVRHLRQTVRFGDGLNAVLKEPGAVLVEVGPGQALSALARLARGSCRPASIVASCRKADEPDTDLAFALSAAGRLWASGHDLDWDRVRGRGDCRRISLPTYAFERQRHWIEPGRPRATLEAKATSSEISRLADVDEWFSVPEWHPTPLAPASGAATRQCLVFSGQAPLGPALEKALADRAGVVRVIRPGEAFGRSADGTWRIDPARPDQYGRLLMELEAEGVRPDCIFYLWALDAAAAQSGIFEPFFHLCQALQRHDPDTAIHLIVATTGTLALPGERVIHPERATLLGPCRAAAREIPLVNAQLVDLDGGPAAAVAGAQHLLSEFDSRACDQLVAYRANARWVQDLVAAPLPKPDQIPAWLTAGGVSVITGGLGAIGLELAQFLATEAKGRLALIGRRELPPRAAWPALASSGELDGDAECVRRLLQIEGAGAELLILRADVADIGQMREALKAVKDRFGRINAVFHAAGVLDDAPLATKTVEDTRRLMSPKVTGGAVLDALLPPGSVDLFAVFSSTSVSVGSPGQVDYIAANAFLDALAASRPDGLAIDWGVWGEIGMAARRYRIPGRSLAGRTPVHPLIGAEISRSDSEISFEAILGPGATWVLEEHIVAGRPVLPGMAYVEIARAAMATIRQDPVEITNLSIVSPLAFEQDQARLVRTNLVATPDGFDFSVQSLPVSQAQAGGGGWTAHAHAQVRFADPAAARLMAGAVPTVDELGPTVEWPAPAQADMVAFGPRWRNLATQRVGPNGGIAEIELSERFASDLSIYSFHPAMADMAATFGVALVQQRSSPGMLFVPMSVERMRLAGPLPRRIRSISRLKKEVENGFVTFDVAFTDLAGNVLATFEGFTLCCVNPATIASLPPSRDSATRQLLQQMLAAGIHAADAPELFRRLLAAPHRRVVVSSIALAELRRLFSDKTSSHAVQPRPANRSPKQASPGIYANDIEEKIATYWAELLGVEQISPGDEFFALGGHSLAAVRLFAKVRKQLGVDLPLASLFEARTLRQFAELVVSKQGTKPGLAEQVATSAVSLPTSNAAKEQEAGDWTPLVMINRGDAARAPFFCVHGGGGNVLTFGDLSRSLGQRQPLYGLQALGVDGRRRPLATIEAMASSYLEAIREVQPKGPYLLGGYSAGGVIAFEMTRRLMDQGETVALLVLFDTVSPILANQAPSKVRHLNADYLWRRPVRGVVRRLRRVLGNQAASHGESSPEVLERDRALIREHLADDAIIPEELRGIHLYDSYMAAQKLYRPTPLPVPTLLFRATEQEKRFLGERLLGWERLITGPIEVRHITSNHLGLMSRTGVERMCAVLRKRLDSLIEGVEPAKRTSQLSSFVKWVAKATSATPPRAPTTNGSP